MDKKQFFENLKTNIGNTVVVVGDKVNKFVSIKKLEFEIGRVKNEIEKIYKDLGVKIYTVKNNGSEDFGDLDAICKQINMKKDYIKNLEKQIEIINSEDQMKDTPVKCTKDIPEFIKHPESSENIGVFKFCPECNTGNEPNEDVCKSCGKKL
ncbi:MAG: hypothetical protein A2Y24_02690 [Clostridiales bacterium GWE2_32_10]|nr:MAG: hypothetical protein A2Y24_02690 [Clostridiales bacterium GWE2_32_10]HBY20116.1 hypothetical protein [Clostridiales bacterium]